jgi:hypothetical protein
MCPVLVSERSGDDSFVTEGREVAVLTATSHKPMNCAEMRSQYIDIKFRFKF